MSSDREGGFTLIELTIASTALAILIGALAAVLIGVFRVYDGTSNRLSDSHDKQLLAEWLVPDIQSSTAIYPRGGADLDGCPLPSNSEVVVQLSWRDASNDPIVVSYQTEQPGGGGAPWTLTRTYCDRGRKLDYFTVVHQLAARTGAVADVTDGYTVAMEVTAPPRDRAAKATFSVSANSRLPFKALGG